MAYAIVFHDTYIKIGVIFNSCSKWDPITTGQSFKVADLKSQIVHQIQVLNVESRLRYQYFEHLRVFGDGARHFYLFTKYCIDYARSGLS